MQVSMTPMMALGFGHLAAWTSAKPSKLVLASLATMCCVLGLAGSVFDYSLAQAAAVSGDAIAGGIDPFAWNGLLGNVLLGSLGVVLAAALVLWLGLWTAPPASVKFAPPRRQLYDAAD